MNLKYSVVFFCVCAIGAYICGVKITDAKCHMQIAKENLISNEQQIKQMMQNKKVLNEKVYKTGVADIRYILQSKYTIAD